MDKKSAKLSERIDTARLLGHHYLNTGDRRENRHAKVGSVKSGATKEGMVKPDSIRR